MKKILLFLPALFAGSLFAQNSIQTGAPHAGKVFHQQSASRQSNPGNNTSSVTIFSENFASGLPGTWLIVNNAAVNEVWHYTTTGSFNTQSAGVLNPNGTTAGNGYMIFDSDSDGAAGTPEDCDLITPSINCTGHPQVFLSVNQYFREYQTDSCLIGISTDGINWTYIYSPDTTVTAAFPDTPNPDHVVLNISSIAANQPTVYVKFHWQGDWDWFWLIDDVMLFEPSPTDVAGLNVKGVSPAYTMIPLQQAANIPISGMVKNLGGTTLTGGTALLEVVDTVSNAVVFSNTVGIPSLAPLASAAVTSSSNFAATTVGYYRTRITTTAAGDADLTNNVSTSMEVLHVTDSTYARDNDVNSGQLGIGAGPANGILGQNFMINANDQVTSVSFFLTDQMNPNPSGSPVYATIHPQAPGTNPGNAIASTDTMLIMPGSIAPGGQWFTLKLNAPLQVTPGLYFAGVHEVDSLLTLGTSSAIFTPQSVWVSWSSIPAPPAVNGWATADDFGFTITYQLRLNMGPNPLGIPVNSNDANISLYPNPSNGMLSVGTGANGKDNVVIHIYDATGALVYSTQTANSQVQIDLSAQAAGVYFVQVTNGNNVSNKKITIAK